MFTVYLIYNVLYAILYVTLHTLHTLSYVYTKHIIIIYTYIGLLLTPLKDSVLVNLIPYNPTEVKEDYHAPTQTDIQIFHTILISYDIHTRIRQEMGQDIASACGQLVLKKQDTNKPNNTTNTTNINSNDKKSSYNTSIEIEDFISKQQAKLTHATYNNTTTTNTNNKSGISNNNQIYQRNKHPPYPLKRKKTDSADLTLPNPCPGSDEKGDDQSGDRNQVPAHTTSTTTTTASNKAITAATAATTASASTSTSAVDVGATGMSKKSSVICGVVLAAMYLCALITTAGNR